MVSARIDSIRTDRGISDEGDLDTANLVVAMTLQLWHYFSLVRILIWHDPQKSRSVTARQRLFFNKSDLKFNLVIEIIHVLILNADIQRVEYVPCNQIIQYFGPCYKIQEGSTAF